MRITNKTGRREIQRYLEEQGFAVYETEPYEDLLQAALEHQAMNDQHETEIRKLFE